MAKKRLERNAEHQRYYLSDGTQVSGASRIAKIGDSSEGIIYWAWDMGMKGIDYRKARDGFADVGHITHFMVDCFLSGDEADLREFTQEEIEVAEPCFEKFLDFWTKEDLTVLGIEEQLVHEELRYGGTLDLRAHDAEGRIVLIDWKSSKRLYNSHKWQLGGYELLANEHYPTAKVERRAIIRTTRDPKDRFHAHWFNQDAADKAMEMFASQASHFDTMERLGYNGRK